MFEYEGFQYSAEEIQQAANEAGLNLNEYISKFNIKKLEEPGKQTPQVPGAPVEETAAPDMASSLESTLLESQEISREEKIKLPFLVRNELSTKGLPFTRENVDAALTTHKARVDRPISQAIQEDIDKGKSDIEVAKQSFSAIANNFYNEDLDVSISTMPGADSPLAKIAARFATSPRLRQAAASISYAALEIVDSVTEGAKALSFVDPKASLVAGVDLDSDEYKSSFAKQKLEAEKDMEKVVGLTEAKGPASMLAAIAGAGAEVGYSLATGALTYGTAPMAEMMGAMVTDYNIQKAKAKYKDLPEEEAIDQLIKNKETDVWLPMALAVPAALAERYALKGTTKFLAQNLTSTGKKQVAKSILINANKEGGTEWVQGALETATSSLGANYDLEAENVMNGISMPSRALKAAQDAFNFSFSKQGLETYLQGLVGTGVISSSKAAIDKLGPNAYRALTATRYAIDGDKVERLTDEIADLIEKKDSVNNPTQKAIYEEEIKKREEELKGLIVNQDGLFEAMSDDDYEEIKRNSDLQKTHIEKVNELREELDLGIIEEDEYNEAYKIYQQRYKEAQARIKGIVNEAQENVSQKNIDIAQKNKELMNIIKNPESKTSQIERAKSELFENNSGVINKLANTKFDPNIQSGFTKEDFIAELNLEFSNLINSYKQEREAEFGAYVARNLPLRIPRIFDRNIQTTDEGDFIATEDVTERRDIAQEETEIDETQETVKKQAVKTMTSELEVPSDLLETVDKAVTSVFSTRLPSVTDKKFKTSLQNAFRDAMADDVKKIFGKKREEYRDYLIKNFDKLYENMPQEAFNKRLPGLAEAVTDETGKQLREKTAVGKGIFQKKQITAEEFADYFVGDDLTPQLISNRKVKLAEIVAEEISKDAAAKIIANPEVQEKFKQVQEILGQEVPTDFPKAIAGIINRLDSFIQALDIEIQKAQGTLNSGLPLPLVLKSFKFFLQKLRNYLANKSFDKAVDLAIKDLKEELKKTKLQPLTQEDIVDSVSDIKEQDLTKDNAKEFIEKRKQRLEGNIAKRTLSDLNRIKDRSEKILSNEKLTDDQKIQYITKTWALYHRGYRNSLRNKSVTEAFKLGKNKALFDFIFPNLPKSLKSRISIKDGRYIFDGKIDLFSVGIRIDSGDISVREQLNKKKAKELYRLQKSKANFYRKLIKQELFSFKKSKDLKGAQILLQGLNGDLSGALSNVPTFGYIVVDKNGDLIKEKYKAEHEYHRNELVNLYLAWVAGDITTEKLDSELDKARLNFDDSSLAKKYDIGDLRHSLVGYEMDGDPKDFRYPQEYFDALKEKGYQVVSFENFNNKATKQEDKQVGINEETKIEIDNTQKLEFRLSEIIQTISKGTLKATRKISSAEAANAKKAFTKGPFSPSAMDAESLFQFLIRKGKEGDQDVKFYEEYIHDPFNKAYYNFNAYVQDKKRQVEAIKKANKEFFKDINTQVLGSYTNDQVIRGYMYLKTGVTPESLGLSEEEASDIITYVNDNEDLLNIADQLSNAYSATEYWIEPDSGVSWLDGSLGRDIYELFSSVERSKFFEEFSNNVDAIFTKDNLNKIEALQGKEFRISLEDMLYRMKTGRARPEGSDPAVNKMWNWFRGSVAVTMFFNTRSAILQTISFTNYANWSDNNPLMMAKAFANIPQYTQDFMFIMNSDYLKQRRGGLSFDVNTQDIADYFSREGQAGTKALLNKMLQYGFTLTQAGDSFAISLGGATFYRNRLNSYLKEGVEQKQAEEKAFLDLMKRTEQSQQSARPDRLSKQQVTKLGRIFLAFQNTPMQYTRMIVRAFKDIAAGRGDIKENLSRIAYYGFVQNIIFSTLQNALFMFMFDDEEEEDERKKKLRDDKVLRVVNNILDTFLRGTGMYGALVATGKNTILEFIEQERRPMEGSGRADHMYTLLEAAQVSPPIGIKGRKLARSIDSYRYNKGVHERMGADIDNPAYDILANMISFGFNIPLDRALTKTRNLKAASDSELDLMYRLLLISGWSSWDLGIDKQREKTAEVKKEIRAERAAAKKPKGVKQIKPKQL
jgi:hypothetical protein